jgi:AAA15 family ATPase/GTPase/5S rRNA maturation endonuclease (ribonuclease M5)
MRYKSFHIKNYKGIKDLTLELDKDPITNIITLVGLNESGKTSILEAISLIDNQPSEKDVHKLIPKNRKFNFSDTIEVCALLEFDVEDEKNITDFCKSIGFKVNNPIKYVYQKLIYVFKNSEFVQAESGIVWEFELEGLLKNKRQSRNFNAANEEFIKVQDFVVKNLIPPLIYYPNFLFDFPNRIYLEKSADEDKEQATYRAVLDDIMDTLNEGLTIEEHIIYRLKNKSEGSEEALESTIERISIQITKVVFSAWGQLFDSKGKEIKLKTGIDESNGLAYLEVRLKEGLNQFQISERSLGFKWFFTFLLFTEFRKNRSSEKGEILFLLDEPASNLHSTAQKNLLTTFQKLVSNCKMIYTTHSHHLINPKWLSSAYIIKNKALDYNKEFDYISDNTDVEAMLYKQFVVKHPEQKTYFQPILDALEYRPGLLEEVPNIVLLEGKNDFYTFKYLNEIVFENRFLINFYPGNGADRNNQIIATYLAWNRDFIILLDGDKAGEDAKKRYLKEFGPIVENKIITLTDIDKSYKFPTENLFTDVERLTITKIFDPSAKEFNKSKFNTALQSLYIEEGFFEFEEKTKNKFLKIFEIIN